MPVSLQANGSVGLAIALAEVGLFVRSLVYSLTAPAREMVYTASLRGRPNGSILGQLVACKREPIQSADGRTDRQPMAKVSPAARATTGTALQDGSSARQRDRKSEIECARASVQTTDKAAYERGGSSLDSKG